MSTIKTKKEQTIEIVNNVDISKLLDESRIKIEKHKKLCIVITVLFTLATLFMSIGFSIILSGRMTNINCLIVFGYAFIFCCFVALCCRYTYVAIKEEKMFKAAITADNIEAKKIFSMIDDRTKQYLFLTFAEQFEIIEYEIVEYKVDDNAIGFKYINDLDMESWLILNIEIKKQKELLNPRIVLNEENIVLELSDDENEN